MYGLILLLHLFPYLHILAAVYNAELVLTGVLRQKLDFKSYPSIVIIVIALYAVFPLKLGIRSIYTALNFALKIFVP